MGGVQLEGGADGEAGTETENLEKTTATQTTWRTLWRVNVQNFKNIGITGLAVLQFRYFK